MKLSVKKVQEVVRLAKEVYPPINSMIIDDDEQSVNDALNDLSSQEKTEWDNYIKNMSDDERYELVALVWLGRGDAGEVASDWESLVKDASSYTEDNTVGYLYGKLILLPQYLEDGVEKLGMN
ncbi:hypothetical protein KKHLCK_08365 [Candidatus Electrothrix laxa]